VREAERQVEVAALRLRAVADAHQLELLLVALRHALHQVCDVRTQRARVHQRLLAALGDLHAHGVALLHQGQPGAQRQLERALGALDRDGGAVDGGGHTLGQRDRVLCDS